MENEDVKKKRGRPKKIKNDTDGILPIVEKTEIIEQKVINNIIVEPVKTPEIIINVIPEFNNINDVVQYIKQNQKTIFSELECQHIIKCITTLMDKLIESNIGLHLEKFTRGRLETLSNKQIDDYKCRLGCFNTYIFIDEYLFTNKSFECTKSLYEEFKKHYEYFKNETLFIAMSDKVIMYKYYN